MNDADTVLPAFGPSKSYDVAKTYYFVNDTQRKELGHALALEALSNPRLKRLRFWRILDAGGHGINVAYPFAIVDYFSPSFL